MEKMQMRFTNAVEAKLVSAPHSTAKAELIEELSDNLYRRFLDMAGAGMPEEEAFRRAMDDLGDVDELLAYLGVQPRPDMTVNQEGGQTRIEAKDGKTVVINSADAQPIIISANGQSRSQGAPEGGEGPQSGPQVGPQSDLDAILASVSEACNTAIDQAKAALKQAKEAVKRRTTWENGDGHVRVHFNTRPDAPTPPSPSEPPAPPTSPGGEGWEFEAEMDADQGRFFAGGGPKQKKDIIYGFGYDKAKGGFFTQWGEWKGEYRSGEEGRGPHFSGQDSSMESNDDGSYSVSALRDLRGIVVQTVAGDVTIRDSEAPEAGVIIDGDVDDLDVTCSADGILTIREGRTASSSFFSRRGIGSADVELSLPRRRWEQLDIATSSGDVVLDGFRLDVDQLRVKTDSGDLSASLHTCGALRFRSASGDIDLNLKDGCADLRAETMSGDVCLHGQVGDTLVKSASGDIEMDGLAVRFLASSMSGDVRLETSQLPQVMEISSKSGDCEARIPDAGPFTLRYKTVSGDVNFNFPFQYQGSTAIYGDGSGPAYVMNTVSGDVSLDRY